MRFDGLGFTSGDAAKKFLTGKTGESRKPSSASNSPMAATRGELFDEKYRVIAVEGQSLTIRGVRSGKVLKIVNPDPATPLTADDYPPGKLIALSDPSSSSPTN